MAAVGAEADIDDDETASENSDNSYSSDNNTESESDEDEDGNLKDFIVPNDNVEEADDEDDDDEDGLSDKFRKRKSKMAKKQKEEKKRRRAKKGKAKEEPSHFSISMMKKEATRSAEGRRRYMRYLKKNWQPSAKVDKCVDLLRNFVQEDEKTIIFSQFVSLLDLLSIPIEREGWKCERYDGSMSADARNDAIVRFTDQPDCKIMLISLKAGNAGLNLVAASRVIILDPFWNPYIEMQAVDRAYRIGQQKSVQVHRILIEETVEDRIIELQQRKKKFVDAALDEGASKSLGRLDERQLAFLFGVGGPA
jgi:SNF2 family DNA or RNA helicase